MTASPKLIPDGNPAEKVTQRRRDILFITVLVLLALGIAIGMIVYLAGIPQPTDQSSMVITTMKPGITQPVDQSSMVTTTMEPEVNMSRQQEIIMTSIQLILETKRIWTKGRLDTSEAVIGVVLSDSDIRDSQYGSLFDVKTQAMNIDLLAALAMDSELRGNTWSRGKLAQYVEGLLASCQEPKDFFGFNLVNILHSQLNQSLDYFKANRFALSWMALALCGEGEEFGSEYEDIFNNTVNFTFGIDEASMVTMACLCLNNTETRRYAEGSTEYVIQHLQEDDDLNAFSLGLAAQALISTKNSTYMDLIDNTTTRLMNVLNISEVMMYGPAVSHILPPLAGKSYLDIRNVECHIPMTTTAPMENVWVTISMEDYVINNTTGQWNVSVSQGATLFTAIQTLEEQDSTFSFESTPTSFGPMITTINNITANATYMYWQILKAPNESASTGVTGITLAEWDHYIFRLTDFSSH